MSRYLIIRLSSLGDIIHTLPAFAALRKAFPTSKISWLVEESGLPLLELVPGLDRIIVVRKSALSRGLSSILAELRRIRSEIKDKSQTVLDFQGLLKSGFYAFLSGAKQRLGFHPKNLRERSAGLFYSRKLAPLPPWIHVIDKNLKLLQLAGLQTEKREFPLVVPEESFSSVSRILRDIGFAAPHKLIVLNVGAAWTTKQWFPERWADLIRRLRVKINDSMPVLLWGTRAEKTLAEKVRAETGTPLVPHLSIPQVLALIGKADLVISGDSFPLQAACALDKPVVGLFGPTHPGRNGPFRSSDRVAWHELECSHCYRRKCPDPKCLEKISSEEVTELTLQVLESHG